MEGGGVSFAGRREGEPASRLAKESAIGGEPDVRGGIGKSSIMGQRRNKSKPMARTKLPKSVMSKAAMDAAGEKVKAESASNTVVAMAGACKSEEPAATRTLKVKMDRSHKFIQWLLEWEKKPRLPLPNNWPEPLRDSFDAFRAFDMESEKVLKEYKLNGFAIVEVDVLDGDDPRASMDEDQYDVVDVVEHEA